MFRDHRESLPWLGFDQLRPCQLVKCLLREPHPSSIPGQELKPTQNLRKELGMQMLGRASQHSSPAQTSGGAGPGSIPGAVVQSQPKC